MKTWIVPFLAAICLASGEAAAEQAASAESPPVASNEDRKVCKRIGSTGSRLQGARICKTIREWREEKEAARQFGDSVQKQIKLPAAG